MDRDMKLRAAGVVTSHISFLAGFALIYWWLSSQGITEFQRLFWGAFAFFGGFCFAGFFIMKRFRLAKEELNDRIKRLEGKKN
jgi:hypothetical protein